jgi:pyruvate formate lyase activating enzyme
MSEMENFEKNYGRIINIQHFSVDDGPGIRTTVFLKGCPLRCAWCHNPESQKSAREFLYRSDKCVLCGVCASVCENGVHAFESGVHTVRRDACVLCGKCAVTCCSDAIEIAGRDISLDEIMDEVLADRIFYRRSGGGITVSGGEPLTQPEFTYSILSACKKEKIHTCVETCGYGKSDDLGKIAEHTDIFLFDFKLADSRLHEHFTGVPNEPILANLAMLSEMGKDIILRCPMIPNVNMTEEHFDKIAALAEKHRNIREIHLEPYHPMGIEKASALGRTAEYARSEFLEKSALTEVRSYISSGTSAEIKIL